MLVTHWRAIVAEVDGGDPGGIERPWATAITGCPAGLVVAPLSPHVGGTLEASDGTGWVRKADEQR
jgi:hypothetical protein